MYRQRQRLQVPYNEPVNHKQKTVDAMRMLAAITDDSLRELVSHALYKVYIGHVTCDDKSDDLKWKIQRTHNIPQSTSFSLGGVLVESEVQS